jgi:hypothetical protein
MVMVPLPAAEPVSGVHGVPAGGGVAAPPLFEEPNFADLLKPPGAGRPAPPSHHSPGKIWSVPLPSSYDVEPVAPNGNSHSRMAPVGILLTPARATILTCVVVLLLALAFGAGLLVGRTL